MDHRYSDIISVFGEDAKEKIRNSKILVVGAGGIGCELLKTLVCVGFENLTVIDLDTIDVSNLNRQFLFRKEHVGKSKALVAGKKAMEFNPNSRIKCFHGNVFDDEFNSQFYSQFHLVINGLDNIKARKQVNRMCLVNSVPMIDGGTRGFDGQVLTTHKGVSECYECMPKMLPKTFAVCTIRQHPSEPIHCVVWAKHCYNEFFGAAQTPEEGATEEEGEGEGRPGALVGDLLDISNVDEFTKKSFTKIFHTDIAQLIQMKDHKTFKRGVPIPIALSPHYSETVDIDAAIESERRKNEHSAPIEEQREWSVTEAVLRYLKTSHFLRSRFLGDGKYRQFDKDDSACMEFVACVTILRAHIFHIQKKTLFDIKSIAGNIIPAIATSNAIIAGLEVLEAVKIVTGNAALGRDSYLKKNPSRLKRKKAFIVPLKFNKPNPECYVCSSNELKIQMNVAKMTLGKFIEGLLKPELGMRDPCVLFSGRLIWDSEDSDPLFLQKTLADLGIANGSMLAVDDMEVEELHWKMSILDDDCFGEGEFKVLSKSQAPVKKKKDADGNEEEKSDFVEQDGQITILDDSDDDDDVMLISDDDDVVMEDKPVEEEQQENERKRKREENEIVLMDDEDEDGSEEQDLKRRKIEK